MALETLRGVKEIDGFDVAELEDFADERPKEFIVVNHVNNGISFKIQDGPIKEKFLNGCQVDTMVATCIKILEGLNKKAPCRENSIAITKLQESYMWLKERKRDREARGVEGTSKG